MAAWPKYMLYQTLYTSIDFLFYILLYFWCGNKWGNISSTEQCKIHKTGNPGRPVVSTCSFPTSIVSKFLDEQFQPLVRSLPSYVKDTNHMLTIVKDFQFPIGSNPLLFTMDVKSLYTVIPNDDSLRALKYFFR